MKPPVLCLLLLLTITAAQAQQDVSNYNIRHFTSENGLSQNSAKTIGCDDYGFIWMATESGLLRFDGSSFRLFDKSNTGIRSSRMLDIRKSPDGKALLGITNNEELLLIDKGTARKYTQTFTDVFLPGAAQKLIFQPVKRLHRQHKLDSLFFTVNAHMGALIVSRLGVVWYPDNGNAYLMRMRPVQEHEEIFPFGEAVYRGAPGLAGDTLQRITPAGVSRVRLRGDLPAHGSRSKPGACFVENYPASGQTFLYAGNHLYQLFASGDGTVTSRHLLSGFDLVGHRIYCAFYDSVFQRIFLGSLTEGLYILDRKNFHTSVYQGMKENYLVNVVYDQVPINDSCVLTGNGTILSATSSRRSAHHRLPGYLTRRDDYTRPLFRSRTGDVWVCGPDSIYRMDSSARRILQKWACYATYTMAESKDGRLWIGTAFKSLCVLDPRKPGAAPQQLLPGKERIISLAFEGEQMLWVCTWRHLIRYDITTGATDTIHRLTDKMTRAVYVRQPGEVWLCTYEDGLYLWQPGKLTRFPVSGYPHLKTVHKILEDARGYFWISTNHGIYQARREDLLAYAESKEKQEEPYFYYYSKESGFLTNEFNGGSQHVGIKLPDGHFSFSSLNGVVFFRPADIRPELPESRIIIDKLEVDDRDVPLTASHLSIRRGFRSLKITPVSAYMGNPANLKYEFRLNDDEKWSKTYNGAVILSSLPPGHNKIVIRKKAGFGSVNHTGYELVLYVPPALWQTNAFYIAVVLALILLLWLIPRLRVRHLEKRNRLLETAIHNRTQDLKDIVHDLERSENRLGEQLQFQRMLNENITHDITTPLKYLTLFTEKIAVKAKEEQASLSTEVSYIHEGTSRIFEVVQSLGQYMRSRLSKNISTSKLNIHNLVARKADLFKLAAAQRNTVIVNSVDPDLFVNQNESLISIIIHNLVDNAVKHTENGKVTIRAVPQDDAIGLSIADTGAGLPPAQIQSYNEFFRKSHADELKLNAGFGFMIIKEIAFLMKLKVTLEETPEKGISFLLLIPRNDA